MSKTEVDSLPSENRLAFSSPDSTWDWVKIPVCEGREWPHLQAGFKGLPKGNNIETQVGSLLVAFCQEIQAGNLNSAIEQTQELVQLASSPLSPAFPDALWLASFMPNPSSYSSLLSLAYEHRAQLAVWPLRHALVGLLRLGQKNQAAELAQLLPSDEIDQVLRESLTSGSLPALGAGFYFPYLPLGSFHHPVVESPATLELHAALLKVVLKNYSVQGPLWLEASIQSYFLKKNVQALELLEEVIQNQAPDSDVLAFKAFLLQQKGEQLQAVKVAKEAVALQAQQPLACCVLGQFYLNFESYSLTLPYLQRALQVAPEYPEALNLYGRLLAKQEGQREKAYEYLTKAVQLEPSHPDYHLYLCIGLIQMADLEKLHSEWSYHKTYIQAFTDKDSARRLITTVLMGAKEPLQEVAVAEMLQSNGFDRAASVFLQRAWRRAYTVAREKQAEFIYHLGVQANRVGELSIALEAFTQLDKIEGALGASPLFISMVQGKQGQYSQALNTLERYRERDFNYHALRADFLYGSGMGQESLSSLEQALEKQPQSLLTLQKLWILSGYLNRQDLFEKYGSNWVAPPDHPYLKTYVEGLSHLFFGTEDAKRQFLNKGLENLRADAYSKFSTESLVEMEPSLIGVVLVELAFSVDDFELLKSIIDVLMEKFSTYDALWAWYWAEGDRLGGHFEKALEALGEFVNLPQAQLSQALCLWDLNRYTEAKAILEKLVYTTDWARPYLHPQGCPRRLAMQVLAKTQQKLGLEAEAKEGLQRAKGLSPA